MSHDTLIAVLGRGLINGALDDDPSGIATYRRSVRNSVMVWPGRWCSAIRQWGKSRRSAPASAAPPSAASATTKGTLRQRVDPDEDFVPCAICPLALAGGVAGDWQSSRRIHAPAAFRFLAEIITDHHVETR